MTWGTKHDGSHPKVDVEYDCRGLHNPHSEPGLRDLDGRDQRVREWLAEDELFARMAMTAAICAQRGSTTLGFFCYGGRHRSVAVAELCATLLRQAGHEAELEHTALEAA